MGNSDICALIEFYIYCLEKTDSDLFRWLSLYLDSTEDTTEFYRLDYG